MADFVVRRARHFIALKPLKPLKLTKLTKLTKLALQDRSRPCRSLVEPSVSLAANVNSRGVMG